MITAFSTLTGLTGTGCSTMKSAMGAGVDGEQPPPIENPFLSLYQYEKSENQNIVLRTRKGERSVEVEFPNNTKGLSEFVIPISPQFEEGGVEGRGPASVGATDTTYLDREATLTDKEIIRRFPKGSPGEEWKRQELENALHLHPDPDSAPDQEKSYLASLDHVKRLYREGRYEAGLIEVDTLVRTYPTDPKIHEMRGTLLKRLGHHDLAMKAWQQALRLKPENDALRKFIERQDRSQKMRGLASP